MTARAIPVTGCSRRCASTRRSDYAKDRCRGDGTARSCRILPSDWPSRPSPSWRVPIRRRGSSASTTSTETSLRHSSTSLARDASSDKASLLEFTVALTRFWYVRGHLSEARAGPRACADRVGLGADLLRRRRGLTAAASIALLQGDYAEATRYAEESLAAARETGEGSSRGERPEQPRCDRACCRRHERAGTRCSRRRSRWRARSATPASWRWRSTTSATTLSLLRLRARRTIVRREPGTARGARRHSERRAIALQPRRRRFDDRSTRLGRGKSARQPRPQPGRRRQGRPVVEPPRARRAHGRAQQIQSGRPCCSALRRACSAGWVPTSSRSSASSTTRRRREYAEQLGAEALRAGPRSGRALSLDDAIEVATQT